MKILFDHQAFSNQTYGGISRYHANLHTGLNKVPGVQSKLGLLFTRNAYINPKELPVIGLFNSLVDKKSHRDKYNKWYCRHLLKQGDFHIFHPTYYNPYFLKLIGDKPYVLTVHDMIHELFPHYFDVIDPHTCGYKAETIKRAAHIITVSESTKNDLQRIYSIPDEKITVIHLGQMGTVQGMIDLHKKDKYLLYVGDRFGYKNFELFVNTIAPLLKQQNLKLICTGGGKFTDTEWEMFTLLHITNNVTQVSVTDEELANLYTNAEAFVFPTLYEGFGLPPLEAFYNNCPVVMSNTSSLPEVGGDAAEYFDPTDGTSIITAIEAVIHNNTRQNELRALGKERLMLFTTQAVIKKTLDVYQSIK